MEESGTNSRLRQRNFYLNLSPLEGHEIASDQGGFVSPAEDTMEAEMRDILAHWLNLQAGELGNVIADCAWWMTRYLDPEAKLDAAEGMQHLDSLTAFVVACMAVLESEGYITIRETDIPDIRISSEGFDGAQSRADIIQLLESMMEEPEDDE
jgi:hypothetical protein